MSSSTTDLRDRFLGCLLGCAVGDALGAPHEGLWSASIPAEDVLLAGFAEVEGYPIGQYTDDTQLPVATVESIVEAGDISYPAIARSIARLWKNQSVVGPGGACTHAATTFLKTGDWTTCGAAVGQAGNGTAMRAAVVGLFFLNDPKQLPAAAANVSKITHHDMRSIAGGVAIAKTAQLLATDRVDSPETFYEAIAVAMFCWRRMKSAWASDSICRRGMAGLKSQSKVLKGRASWKLASLMKRSMRRCRRRRA